MTRLPPALGPLWPLVKRAHRRTTRVVGAVGRPAGRLSPGRGVPRRATLRAEDTAAGEPDAVRLHVGGPAELLVREPPRGDPADHWFLEQWSRLEVPRRFVLELRDGLVVGDQVAHVTAGGVLDLETSPYFGIRHWREHPVYLRPRLPEPRHQPGTLLSLATRGAQGNYYHWVMDALPRLGILRECLPEAEVGLDALLVGTRHRYHREHLALLGLDHLPRVEVDRDLCVRADRLLVPSLPNAENISPRWTTSWLRDNLPAQRVDGRPRRIYVTRGRQRHTRVVTNENEVLAVLRPLGFEVVDPGALSVQDQIDHFAAAEVVVAPHGAALTNLVFCSPGVRVLELFAPGYLNPGYWTLVETLPDAHYRYLVGEGRPVPPGRPMLGVMHDVTVDVARLRASLAELGL